MSDTAYVVESPAIDGRTGERVGTLRVYVATEERACSIASEQPDRTYRAIAIEDMPTKARDNLVQSRLV